MLFVCRGFLDVAERECISGSCLVQVYITNIDQCGGQCSIFSHSLAFEGFQPTYPTETGDGRDLEQEIDAELFVFSFFYA